MKRLFRIPWRTRAHIEDDVERELAFHLESRVADLVAMGASEHDARERARHEFGDLDDARRYMVRVDNDIEISQRRRDHVQMLWQDITYALRRIRSAPVFALTAILTLALGIGANTAVFSVVDAALLRPLPYPNADRVAELFELGPRGRFVASAPDFADWRAQSHSFDEMAAVNPYGRTLTGIGEPRSIPGASVTGGFFRIFGVAPEVGRDFTPDEIVTGNSHFAVIAHALWQQSFGGRRDVIGRTMQLDGMSYTIVGVMPSGFTYPGRTQIWTPLAFTPDDMATQRGAHYLEVVGLLKRGVTLSSADGDVRLIATRLAQQYPNTNKGYSATVTSLRNYLVGDASKRALIVLLVAVALVALIACANVANLVLARGTSRGREMAVRLALGASPRDLAYMAVTESVLLALFGGIAGFLLAKSLAGALDALRPEALQQVGALEIRATAGLFTFVVSLLLGALFGIGPGMQAARRSSLQQALAAGGRTGSASRESGRLRAAFVAAEIALAVVLVSGAGLLIKSFVRLESVDAGFDASHLVTYSLSLPDARYSPPERARIAIDEIVRRTTELPGVTAAGAISILPLSDDAYSITTSSIDGVDIPPTEQPSTQVRIVTAGALPTLGVTMKAGRGFEAGDRAGGARVVLVSESAARLLWKGVNPIGHRITIGTRFGLGGERGNGTVVGVVSDIHDASLGAPPRPTVYFPHSQTPVSDMTVVIRTAANAQRLSVLNGAREVLRQVDPLLPMVGAQSMDDVAAASVAQPRFATLLMTIFAALAMTLAAIGVFGVVGYVVGQRTREIGIRMALGASQTRVVSETVLQAATPLFVGLVAGVAGTLAVVQLLTTMLHDVAPYDPVVLGGVTIGLAVVALAAAYLPARRASGVDPLLALRSD
jgi:putative ABC transport system permease protein